MMDMCTKVHNNHKTGGAPDINNLKTYMLLKNLKVLQHSIAYTRCDNTGPLKLHSLSYSTHMSILIGQISNLL